MFPFTPYINLAGWFHFVYFGILIPYLVFRNRRKAVGSAKTLPNRLVHFQRTVFEIGMFTLISLMVAWVQRIELFPGTFPTIAGIIAGFVCYFSAVAYMLPRWRGAVKRKSPIVHLFMPSNGTERAWWVAVSILAGVGEEITWRGVQLAIIAAITGEYWSAAIVCSIMFGLAHLVQGWKSAGVIVFFGLGFHLLVWLSNSLYVAMVVHIAYDITAGLNYGRLGKQLGYRIGPVAPNQSDHIIEK